ncbi:MAG: DUF2029 domain-containing protein [Roseiflexaceae bacterium]|nr:DUF2029 domain-containing protein [Roseiflexaceae bacterium]
MPLIRILARLFNIAALLLLGSLVLAHLGFFAIRATHLLEYPFPLDYGEGPLLAQVNLLRAGLPIWQLYGDPAAAPYTVVNYPPIYHGITWLIGLATVPLIGDGPHGILLAGRIVSLLAGLLCVPAIVMLAQPAVSIQHSAFSSSVDQESGVRSQESEDTPSPHQQSAISKPPVTQSHITIVLVALALLGIPIMREWSSVMRVDLLGVCLGLWGLVIISRRVGTWQILWAAPVLALALLTKPSLVAAPAAAVIWLLFRDWRRAIVLGGLIGGIGGLAIGVLQLASRGWFWVHVVSANANPWDFDLAHGFWRDQIVLMQPLLVAVVLMIGAGVLFKPRIALLLPGYYTLFGLMTAFGVGKLGAYSNYFLEAYAGLFWLVAAGMAGVRSQESGVRSQNTEPRTKNQEPNTLNKGTRQQGNKKLVFRGQGAGVRSQGAAPHKQSNTSALLRSMNRPIATLLPSMLLMLTALALTRYYPLWSEEYLLPAGIIEGRNPVRNSFGGNGIWQDLQREQIILNARATINRALAEPIRAANGPIFTDIPGVAAQLAVTSREQVFEQRMLFDIGLWDQRPLLRDMASGRVPLIVLDYLGNWLTPAQISIITHRYAQDLSIGTYSIYRPIDPGPRRDLDLVFPHGLHATGIHLAQPGDGGRTYGPGETLAITLEWQQTATDIRGTPDVVLQLADRTGRVLFETTRPLLYGVLAPNDWSNDELQHVQPLSLPAELPDGSYRLMLTLRANGQDLAIARDLSTLVVAERGGRILGEQGYYVPKPFFAEWERLGGYGGPGDPVMPAVPFAGFVQQCFKTTCLRLANGQIERLPAGELTWMADAGLPRIAEAPPEGQLSPAFQQLYDQSGGAATLGPVLGVEMKRFGDIVQYTRYARLERPLAGGPARLGNVGEDVLRLPGGTPYLWP